MQSDFESAPAVTNAVEDLLNLKGKRIITRKREEKVELKKSTFVRMMENETEGNCDGSLKRVRKNRDQLKALKRAYDDCRGNWTKQD